MELLQNLQNNIEGLKANPSDVNVDQLIDILSQAYDLARDGLDRSQNAAKYLETQKRMLELEPLVTELTELNAKLSTENETHLKNIKALRTFAEYLRKCAGGKVEALKTMTREAKNVYAEKIKKAEFSGLVELMIDVENRFANDFERSSKTLEINDKSFINQKLYET